jgi:uncharacterized protein (TIGR01244 family)
MKYLTHLIIISFLFAVEPVFSQDSVSFPVKLDSEGFREVLVKVDNLYISGQPDEESFRKLKSEGLTTVINLRTEKEMNNRELVPFDEESVMDSLKLEYIRIPLGGADSPYNNEALIKFADALENADGDVLLHCASARRASYLWAAYLIQFKDFSPDKAIEYAKAINFEESPLEGLLGKKMIVEFE